MTASIVGCRAPLLATTSRWYGSNGAAVVGDVPPASSMRIAPAAMSHGCNGRSQKPSNRPAGDVAEVERRRAVAADALTGAVERCQRASLSGARVRS